MSGSLRQRIAGLVALASLVIPARTGFAAERQLDSFKRQQLSDEYYSEGANAGDLNRDGKPDVVYGPYWFEGPAFEKARDLSPQAAAARMLRRQFLQLGLRFQRRRLERRVRRRFPRHAGVRLRESQAAG